MARQQELPVPGELPLLTLRRRKGLAQTMALVSLRHSWSRTITWSPSLAPGSAPEKAGACRAAAGGRVGPQGAGWSGSVTSSLLLALVLGIWEGQLGSRWHCLLQVMRCLLQVQGMSVHTQSWPGEAMPSPWLILPVAGQEMGGDSCTSSTNFTAFIQAKILPVFSTWTNIWKLPI